MIDAPAAGRRVRLRTAATDKRKALEHYQDLRRSGRVSRAVVIAEDRNGDITVLGQMLKPSDIAELLLLASGSIDAVDAARERPTRENREEPFRRGEHNGQPERQRDVTWAEDGTMVPPPLENIISCGECHHPRWYVLHYNANDRTSRYVCAHCGNEVKIMELI